MKIVSGLALTLLLVLTPLAGATGPRAAAEPSTSGGSAAWGGANNRADPLWYVVARTRNKCDQVQLLRRGKAGVGGWGYRKIATKHNIRRIKVWRRVIEGSCGKPEGGVSTTYIYRARILHVICTDRGCTPTGEFEMLRLVQQTRNNQGAITMYCVGKVLCPNWINTGYLPRARHGWRSEVRVVPVKG